MKKLNSLIYVRIFYPAFNCLYGDNKIVKKMTNEQNSSFRLENCI